MELSEAIKILKNYREELWKDNSRVEGWAESGEDLEKMYAIDTVLQELEKLQKENVMLENTKNNCPYLNTSGVSCTGKFCDLDDYISKDKIKEKIEELEAGSDKADGWRSEYLYAKEVLEELLKGE